MFKVVWLLKFNPELDPEEARRWWRTDHGAIALKAPGIRRYIQNHWVEPAPGSARTYDGSVDCWFDSREAYEATLASPEWQALMDDDVKLFDRTLEPASEGGAVREYIMRWDALPDGRVYQASDPTWRG